MSDLSTLADDLLASDLAASPVMGSALGLTEHDERLDDLSAEAFERRDADAAAFLARFDALSEDGLAADEAIDRDLARAVLRGRGILADWQAWKRDPLTYSSPVTSGIFTLFLHRLRPERELVDASIARMGQVGNAVDAGIANLDPALASPLIVERGLGAARAAVRYLRELVALDVEDTGDRDRLLQAGDGAAREMERWVAHLATLAKQTHGTWQRGEERYSRILREREASATTPARCASVARLSSTASTPR